MIRFETPSILPLEAISTFGVTSKPNSETPIGRFGTGLKYAIAVTLRLGGTFRLLVDGVEYEFYTRASSFRTVETTEVMFRRRSVLSPRWFSRRLPFTLHLGSHWEAWMALRELESNTRDEGGVSQLVSVEPALASESHGRTIIEVDCPEMETEFVDDAVFLPPDTDILYANHCVEVREGPSNWVYMNGIRVQELPSPSIFTYNLLDSPDLTEDRTLANFGYERIRIMQCLRLDDAQELHERVLEATESDWEASLDWDFFEQRPDELFTRRIAGRENLPLRLAPAARSARAALDPGGKTMLTLSLTLPVKEWRRLASGQWPTTELRNQVKEALE